RRPDLSSLQSGGVGSGMAAGVLWVDVGDLFWWPFEQVSGIQRTMASIVVELIDRPPPGREVRFCAYTPERDFHVVPHAQTAGRARRLLGLPGGEPPPPPPPE